MLNVSGTVTNSGYLTDYTTMNIGSLNNTSSGTVTVYGGVLNLTNQPNGIVTLEGNYVINGIFMAGANNAFANLTTVNGNLYGAANTTPQGGTIFINGIVAGSLGVNGNAVISSTGSLLGGYQGPPVETFL